MVVCLTAIVRFGLSQAHPAPGRVAAKGQRPALAIVLTDKDWMLVIIAIGQHGGGLLWGAQDGHPIEGRKSSPQRLVILGFFGNSDVMRQPRGRWPHTDLLVDLAHRGGEV